MAVSARWRLWVVLLAVACILGVAIVLLSRPKADHLPEAITKEEMRREAPRPAGRQVGDLPPVNLRLGASWTMPAPEPRGGDCAHVLQDGQGGLWVFLAQMKTFQFSRWADGKFSSLASMPALGDWGAEHSAVALTEANWPIVFWQTFEKPGSLAIVSSRWDGKAWSQPEVLDRSAGGEFIHTFEALRDAEGTVHLFYDRRMSPPEVYSDSLIVVDASQQFRPRKPFHVYLQKGVWSKPACTTEPGKFDLSSFHVTVDPQGSLFLGGKAEEKGSSEQGYVVAQSWRGGKWSPPKRLTPTSAMFDAWACWDSEGTIHIWSGSNEGIPWRYQKLSDGQVRPIRELPAPDQLTVKALPGGRIAQITESQVCVWTGRDWSPPLGVGGQDASVTPTERLLLGTWSGPSVRVQEVTLAK